MKRPKYSKSVSTLMGLAAFAVSLPAATFCVNPAGSGGCMPTIGAAVAAASAGDTVLVGPGTYKEAVVIGKALQLVGAGAATTVIDATGMGNGIFIDGFNNPNLANVSVSGFTVQNANYEGILAAGASHVRISNNVVTGNDQGLVQTEKGPTCPGIVNFDTGEAQDCGEGIHLNGVTNSVVLNNTVQGNAGGILLTDEAGATSGNVLTGNTVSNNPYDCGITLASHPPAPVTGSKTPFGVSNNSIIGNTSSQNGLGAKGEGAGVGIFANAPGTQDHDNLVLNNRITGNGMPGVAIHGHAPGQNLDGNAIIGNTIGGNGPDTGATAPPVSAGVAITTVSPVHNTVVLENQISGQVLGVSWNVPGQLDVHGNTFSVATGVYNLGKGTINADNNWWGCGAGPLGLGGLTGCANILGGGVTISNWMTTPPNK